MSQCTLTYLYKGFSHGTSGKDPACQCRRCSFSLGQENPLEEGMATYSSIFVWRIPWTAELGELQTRGLQRVRHHCRDLASMLIQLNMSILYPCLFSGFICPIPLQQLFMTLWTVACQAPLSMEFSRQEYWSIAIPYSRVHRFLRQQFACCSCPSVPSGPVCISGLPC